MTERAAKRIDQHMSLNFTNHLSPNKHIRTPAVTSIVPSPDSSTLKCQISSEIPVPSSQGDNEIEVAYIELQNQLADAEMRLETSVKRAKAQDMKIFRLNSQLVRNHVYQRQISSRELLNFNEELDKNILPPSLASIPQIHFREVVVLADDFDSLERKPRGPHNSVFMLVLCQDLEECDGEGEIRAVRFNMEADMAWLDTRIKDTVFAGQGKFARGTGSACLVP